MALTRKIYYSITEVAEMADVKPHVLRYWETEFAALRPRKNRAGNRTYRDKDVRLVLLIKKLLYDEGFTIKGARRKLQERKGEIAQIELPFERSPAAPAGDASIASLRKELEGILSYISS